MAEQRCRIEAIRGLDRSPLPGQNRAEQKLAALHWVEVAVGPVLADGTGCTGRGFSRNFDHAATFVALALFSRKFAIHGHDVFALRAGELDWHN